ncbi:helix-turn-helix domain-containing protein [Actinotalea sp. JY-7885]|nr:helix-turn-helix domain-containing protein [Actinotalea sp. JY-7885]
MDRSALRAEALRLAAEGRSQRAIADTLGASKSSVARWLASETEAAPVGA